MTYDVITGEKMQKYKLFSVLIGILLICLAVFWFFVYPVNAIIPVYPYMISNSSIGWNYSTIVNNISIDGIFIQNYDPNAGFLIVNNLKSNTVHEINVYSFTDHGANITKTLPDVVNQSNQDKFYGILLVWVLFIIALIFLIAGFYGVPFVSLIGGVICLFELISSVTNGSFIMDILYMIVIIASVLLARGEI